MCTRIRVRSIHGIELETTQFSGEGENGGTFFTPMQAAEFCARVADEYDSGLPEPQIIKHPTTDCDVLEVWEDHFDSHIFHLNNEGLFDVSELSWDD